jgi:hypothetical protein
MAMRPLTLPDLVALAVGQALALVTACASTYGVWLWLAATHPFR